MRTSYVSVPGQEGDVRDEHRHACARQDKEVQRLSMGKGMCQVVGRACQVAGVDEACGVGNVNERRTM